MVDMEDLMSEKESAGKAVSLRRQKPKKVQVPFGSSTPRFGKMTHHPELDKTGLFVKRDPGCDPCLYRPMPQMCRASRTPGAKDPWRYKNELEAWSRNLGYRNQRVLEERRWQRTLLGPAWLKLPPEHIYEPACKNVLFGRTPRFKPPRVVYPGPGTYYSAHPYKAPHGPHSTRATMEREEPCRFPDRCPRWSLAPNRYVIVDPDDFVGVSKRVVSLRGPYDLFTGKRDGTSIKNHFNSSLQCNSSTWPLALKGSLEKYKKTHFGQFNKSGREDPYRGRLALVDLAMCVKKTNEPGPAHYGIGTEPRKFKQNPRGFNSTYDRPPGYVRVVVWPGIGRYSIARPMPRGRFCDGIPGHGHKHVFLSKIGRTIGAIIPEPMNSF